MLLDRLEAAAPGAVSINATVRAEHGRDESAHRPALPDAVVTPADADQVAGVLRVCHDLAVPVVPFGAGSSLEGHVLPVRGGVSLDLSRLDRVHAVRPDDLVAVVGAGVRRTVLNDRLARDGLFFPVDPGADATLGGMAATNASGTTTPRYGSMRDNVLGLTAVTVDGRVIRTGGAFRKDSAGYDLTRLLVGSEGTLAVITDLTLRVFGIPERMAAATCRFTDLHGAVAAATAVMRSGIPIARCEFLDAATIACVNAYDELDLDEQPTLFFEFHGSVAGVAEQARDCGEIVAEFGGSGFTWSADEQGRRALWRARHHAYFAAIASRPGCRAVSTDSAVPLSRLPDAVAAVGEEMAGLRWPALVLGHLADGNVHCLLRVDPDDPDEVADAVAAADRLSVRVIGMGGTCSGEHGIGIGKRVMLEHQVGPDVIGLMLAVKNAFDPRHLLNPGKVLRGSDQAAAFSIS